eukprot:gene7518-9015_t
MIIALILHFIATFAVSHSISDLDLYDFESSQRRGFRVMGEANGDAAGISVNIAGDVNNDGLSDIIIKAKDAVNFGNGASYILFGQNSAFNFVNIELENMVSGPSTGFRVRGGGGATNARSGTSYSEIALCGYSASLLCAVIELSDTTFVMAVVVPYTEQTVYLGQYNALPLISIVEPSTSADTVGTVRSYVYTPSAVRSVVLTHMTSVTNFAGVFAAGTGNIADNGATVPVIVAGWVSTSSGVLSAMYITPVGSTITTDKDLVNVIAMVGTGPDSIIAGGLTGSSVGAVTTAYLVRINSLYKTASFGAKYISKFNARTRTIVKGMVPEGSAVYLLVNIAPPTSARTIAVLKVNIATGTILQQMTLSLQSGNVTCSRIIANVLSLHLTCAAQETEHAIQSLVLATKRDLSFKRLPVNWSRNCTISFTRQLSPFSATAFTAPTASKVIPSLSFTYSTLGQSPTWRPTTAPTIDSPGHDSDPPTMEARSKQGGLTTEAIVIGVGAAGGALGFGLIALLLCAACSYKLRKNREKYVERRKTMLPMQDIHTMTLEARRIETLKVLNETLKATTQGATQRTTTSNSITPIHTTASPEGSPSQSVDANSLSDSSFEMSSLHSSEMSETDSFHKIFAAAPRQEDSVRRLSEMEAQRVLSTEESNNTECKGVDVDDDSSIERGFNEIMAEFSDDSNWDGTHL